MENYTRVIGATSTNIRTPTTEEINQGNNALTPFDSAKNNGYINEVSEQVKDISAELINLITEAGLTPNGTLTQVKEAIDLVIGDNIEDATTSTKGVVELATDAEVAVATDTQRAIVPSALASLFSTASSLTSGSSSFASLVKDTADSAIKVGITKCKLQSTTISPGGSSIITFDSAFPTACVGVVPCPVTWTVNPQNVSLFVTARTASQFTISNPDGDTNITSFFYIAIGF